MDMRISSATNLQSINNAKKTFTTKRQTRADETTDSVLVSKQAQEFSVVLKAVRETPDVRESKVEDIKKRIDSGNYNVTSNEIANKMLGIKL